MPQADLQQLPANSNSQSNASTSSTSTTANNSEVMQQLQGKGPELPQTDIGEVSSGSSFAKMAGGVLDSVIPTEGSSLKFALTGAIPLYKTPGVTVTFKPALKMGVENKFGKLRASIELAAGVEVSAGVETWLVDFQAALEARFSGTLSIHGDSGTEIFQEFLLSLRYIVESACETVSMPDRFKDPIVDGIMSDEDMLNTVQGMDKRDKVSLDLKAGLKGSASAGGLEASASASVGHSMILRNDGNDELETATQESVSVQVGPFTGTRKWLDGNTLDILNAKTPLPMLGKSANASVMAILSNEVLNKVKISGSVSVELTLGMLKDKLFGDDGWIASLKDSVTRGIISLNKQIDNPLLSKLAAQLGSTPTSEAKKTLSPDGEELLHARASLDAKVKVSLVTSLTWERGKGFLFRVELATNASSSLGFGDNKIEITKNDRLALLSIGNEGLSIDIHPFN